MVRDSKPRRSSVSELRDWKGLPDLGNGDSEKERESRRRRRSGTWP